MTRNPAAPFEKRSWLAMISPYRYQSYMNLRREL